MAITKEKNSKESEVIKTNFNNKLKKCFVITPIGNENSEIRRQIDGIIDECIIPVLSEFEVSVSHRICTTGSINNQILKHIFEDELVIANLTNLNPNVMYELAFRHSLRKPVIVIKNKDDGFDIPFDIKEDRTIFYTNDIMGTKELKEQLKTFLKEIDYKDEADNPISRAVNDLKVRKSLEVVSAKTDGAIEHTNAINYLISRIDSVERKLDNNNRNYNAHSSYLDSDLKIETFKSRLERLQRVIHTLKDSKEGREVLTTEVSELLYFLEELKPNLTRALSWKYYTQLKEITDILVETEKLEQKR